MAKISLAQSTEVRSVGEACAKLEDQQLRVYNNKRDHLLMYYILLGESLEYLRGDIGDCYLLVQPIWVMV
jgi:hypothetical protein